MLGDPAEAEDVAQDTFVRAYRALGGYAAGADPRAAPRPVAGDDRRQRRAQPDRRRRADRDAAAPLTFLDELDAAAIAAGPAPRPRPRRPGARPSATAGRPLLALPERYRVPIVLRHVDGLVYDEIAVALDRPEGTVKAQVHRGLALLRAAWDAAEREEAIA